MTRPRLSTTAASATPWQGVARIDLTPGLTHDLQPVVYARLTLEDGTQHVVAGLDPRTSRALGTEAMDAAAAAEQRASLTRWLTATQGMSFGQALEVTADLDTWLAAPTGLPTPGAPTRAGRAQRLEEWQRFVTDGPGPWLLPCLECGTLLSATAVALGHAGARRFAVETEECSDCGTRRAARCRHCWAVIDNGTRLTDTNVPVIVGGWCTQCGDGGPQSHPASDDQE